MKYFTFYGHENIAYQKNYCDFTYVHCKCCFGMSVSNWKSRSQYSSLVFLGMPYNYEDIKENSVFDI